MDLLHWYHAIDTHPKAKITDPAQIRKLEEQYKLIVDLMGCFGTEPPYVMVSRATSLDGLILLRDFGAKQISKQRSEDLRKEFARLAHLRWHTITRYGAGAEVEATNGALAAHGVKAGTRGTKRKSNANDGPSAKSSRKRL